MLHYNITHTTLPLIWVYYKSLYATLGFLLQLCVTAFLFYSVLVVTLWGAELIPRRRVRPLLLHKVVLYMVVTGVIVFAVFALLPTPVDMAFHYSHLACEVLR